MSWQVVDTKQKKAEKRQQRSEEKKKLQIQIEKERQKRREEEERLSYSGWGPEAQSGKGARSTAAPPKSKKNTEELPPSTSFTTQTIYDALRAIEDKEQRSKADKREEEQRARREQELAAKQAEAERKKAKKAKKPKKPTLSQLSSALNVNACKEFLNDLSQRYPSKFDVQLMVLADFFESKFGKASLGPAKLLEEKTFARKLEIPYAYLDEEVRQALRTWLETVPPTAMAEFTRFLLSEIASVEKSHKTSGIGLRMLLAAISRGFPEVVRSATHNTVFTQKYLGDTPASYPQPDVKVLAQNTSILRANYLPVLLWYFGQTIEDHPALAFSLWVEFLQPFLFLNASESTVSSVLDFFKLLFGDSGKHVKSADLSSTVLALERLATYRESLSENQLKKSPLSSVYVAIEKAIVWRNTPLVHNYLETFLRRAASTNRIAREEAQKSVLRALAVDKESFQTWRKLYPQYVSQSTHVILLLTEKWAKYVSTKDRSMIQPSDVAEVVTDFLYANDKLAEANKNKTARVNKKGHKEQHRVDPVDLEASNAACKSLLKSTGAQVTGAAQSRGKQRSSSSSTTSSGLLGVLVYILLLVSVVALIAVLYIRQSQPETYEQLLRTGLIYYREGSAQAHDWGQQAAAYGKELLAKSSQMKAQLLKSASGQ